MSLYLRMAEGKVKYGMAEEARQASKRSRFEVNSEMIRFFRPNQVTSVIEMNRRPEQIS
jgi:hypothetical protein